MKRSSDLGQSHDHQADAWSDRSSAKIVAAFDSVDMTFAGSAEPWGYGGGRDLAGLSNMAEKTGAGWDV